MLIYRNGLIECHLENDVCLHWPSLRSVLVDKQMWLQSQLAIDLDKPTGVTGKRYPRGNVLLPVCIGEPKFTSKHTRGYTLPKTNYF